MISSRHWSVISLIVLLCLSPFLVSSPLIASAQSATISSSGYKIVQLSNTKYDNCFLPAPYSGNPLFGDPRTWQDSTSWTNCNYVYYYYNDTDAYGYDPYPPVNISYSALNSSTEIPRAFMLNYKNASWPVTGAVDCLSPSDRTMEWSNCFWYYRGEIVFPYDLGSGQGNLTGVYGYNTAGSNTQTGQVNNIMAPSGDMFLAGCETGQISIIPYSGGPGPAGTAQSDLADTYWPGCQLSITYPSLSGSSAAIGIAYNMTIPEQQFMFNGRLYTVTPQYTILLVQYVDGEWVPFTPTNGAPDPNEYSIDEVQTPAGGMIDCLDQSMAPISIISGGYSAFAYAVEEFDNQFPATGTSCTATVADWGDISTYVADLNVIGNAQLLSNYDSPSTCGTGAADSSDCFDGFAWMSGDLLIYTAGPNYTFGTYYLVDVLHPTNSLEPVSLAVYPISNMFYGTQSDGNTLGWLSLNSSNSGTPNYNLWNGNLGSLEAIQGVGGKIWIDDNWLAMSNNSLIQFYELANTSIAYVQNPTFYTAPTPNQYFFNETTGWQSQLSPNSLVDMVSGEAVWVSNLGTNSSGNEFYLNWYNATQAEEGRPANGSIQLGWASQISDMVLTNDWVYLSALPVGGQNFQIYAIQLPSTFVANQQGGSGSAEFYLSGNVSSSQITQATFVKGPNGKVVSLDLTVTGTSGTVGNMTITVPKSYVEGGSIPSVLIDGVLAQVQSFSQDAKNYYVTFSIHFSTDTVQINFGSLSTTSTSTAPSTSASGSTTLVSSSSTSPILSTTSQELSSTQNTASSGLPSWTLWAVVGVVVVLFVVSGFFLRSRRNAKST